MHSSCAQAALAYLSRGWSVLPFWARDKRPLVSWTEYQRRLPTEAEVRAWFAKTPDANVGVVTGTVSQLVVVDIDPAHGGAESLTEIEREHGPLPHTLEVITGGGGRHVYFAHPGGLVHNRVSLFPGIDVRGDGGCVVAPPSLHRSGQRYRWASGHEPESCRLAPMPSWLLQRATDRPERIGHPLAYWRRLVAEGISEGERNNTIASMTGHLLWHGVDPDVALELLLCWNRLRCRPPLSDEEVVRILDSITRLHQQHDWPVR
ncbi:MAG: Bifunctional primase/polymerase [Proteobacteria bacterium]|nr:Bifunctional primase/polymerase [Pseudomonadota bacterium]